MKFLLLLAFAGLFLSNPLPAQQHDESESQGGMLGLHAILAFPSGAFAEHFEHVGLGGGLDLAYAPPSLPVAAGLSMNLSWFAMSTSNIVVEHDRYDGHVDIEIASKLATLNLFARLQPHTGPFRPFVEGLAGLFILWTDCSVDESYEQYGLHGNNAINDATFGFGASGGIEYLIGRGLAKTSEGSGDAYVSVRIRYFAGGELEYINGDRITFNREGEPIVAPEDVLKSKLEILQIIIGLTARF